MRISRSFAEIKFLVQPNLHLEPIVSCPHETNNQKSLIIMKFFHVHIELLNSLDIQRVHSTVRACQSLHTQLYCQMVQCEVKRMKVKTGWGHVTSCHSTVKSTLFNIEVNRSEFRGQSLPFHCFDMVYGYHLCHYWTIAHQTQTGRKFSIFSDSIEWFFSTHKSTEWVMFLSHTGTTVVSWEDFKEGVLCFM